MKRFTYQIKDPCGMHARPAGKLCAVAKQYASAVHVRFGDEEADAKRLLSLMRLGAVSGAELVFTIEGEDEDKAETALAEHCRLWSEGDI